MNDVIDRSDLSRLALWLIVLCGLVGLLDGFDTQAIGFVAAGVASTFGLKATALGAVLSAGLFGAMLGAVTYGTLADRFGRKRLLIACVLLFAIGSLATTAVTSFVELLGVRFFTGLGLGGATPTFLALAAEVVPSRMRSKVVALLWAAFPIGAMAGGLCSSCVSLPESVRYLVARRSTHASIARIVATVDRPAPVTSRYINDKSEMKGRCMVSLFSAERRRQTIALRVPFFLWFMILAIVTLWTPALVHGIGLSSSTGALLIAADNFGSAAGMVSAGVLSARVGTITVAATSFGLGALSLMPLGYLGASPNALLICYVVAGYFMGAGAAAVIALAAQSYLTMLRSTGNGWAMGIGRFGQSVGPIAAGSLIASGWTIAALFAGLAVPAAIATCFVLIFALGTIRREAIDE